MDGDNEAVMIVWRSNRRQYCSEMKQIWQQETVWRRGWRG